LTQLKNLNLDGCSLLTDAGLEHLKGLTELKYLELKKCPNITGAGIDQLRKSLPDCKISAEPKNTSSRNNSNSRNGKTSTTETSSQSDNTSRNENDTKIVSNLSNQPTNTANEQDQNKNSNPFIISPQEKSPPISPQKTDTKEQKTTDNKKSATGNKVDAMGILTGVAFGDIGSDKNNNKPVSQLPNESADAVISRKQNENRNTNAIPTQTPTPTTTTTPKQSQSDSKKLSLKQPEELIKMLQNINGLKSVVDVQRFVNLLEFADASQNDELYFDLRKKFFHAIKANIKNSYTRIEFVEEILPAMIHRNNFDGLKASITDIDVIMEQPAPLVMYFYLLILRNNQLVSVLSPLFS
jgi:hypothetical protein